MRSAFLCDRSACVSRRLDWCRFRCRTRRAALLVLVFSLARVAAASRLALRPGSTMAASGRQPWRREEPQKQRAEKKSSQASHAGLYVQGTKPRQENRRFRTTAPLLQQPEGTRNPKVREIRVSGPGRFFFSPTHGVQPVNSGSWIPRLRRCSGPGFDSARIETGFSSRVRSGVGRRAPSRIQAHLSTLRMAPRN